MRRQLRVTVLPLLVTVLAACESGGQDGASGFSSNTRLSVDTSQCTAVVPGQDFRNDMLCAHNNLRRSIPSPQPVPDPPLPALTWNAELAEFARAYAEACTYEHSDPASREKAFGQWVGENIAAATADTYSNQGIFNLWAHEAADYDYASNTCEGPDCGHYTQIIWRETTQVGCAKATCDTLTNEEDMGRADYWVCEYLPGGNITGQRPY